MSAFRLMRAWIPALVFLAVLAVRCAEPVLDGDLFWHMSYAKQMLAHHTLVADHTIYSWTPADGKMIYCAWLAEMTLLGIWNVLGLTGIFILRYAVVLGVAAMWHDLGRRSGVPRGPLFWLVLLIALVASYVGTLPKPELFSLLFFSVLVWLLFRAKLAAARGASCKKWLSALPVLFLVWVNTHGAFILSAPVLAAFVIGEALHSRRGKMDARLPLGPLLVSVTLSAAASICTPYGIAYPVQLVEENVLFRTPRPDGVWNAAYQNVLSASSWHFGFPGLLLAMIFIFVAALWFRVRRRRGPADWSVLFAFAGYAVLFTVYLRTTFYLAPVFVAGTFFLLRGDPVSGKSRALLPFGIRIACRVAFLALAAFTIFQCALRPPTASWLGFGIGGSNPVDEAEFLARRKNADPRLVNLFNTGGYLLWRLWPQYSVMVDSRSFPYLGWFDEQYRFGTGRDFDSFLKKYPAPLAVIDLDRIVVWQNFLRSPDWRPVFYGPAAVVFERAGLAGDAPLETLPPERLRGLRNAEALAHMFTFARFVADYRTAWFVADQLERPWLRWQLDAAARRRIRAYREAHDVLRHGAFDQAGALFREALTNTPACDRDVTILALLTAYQAAAGPASSAGERRTIEDGLRALAAPQ